MFSRRRRGSSASRHSAHLPLDKSTTNNAAVAASQAFLAGRPPSSSGSLSSAAAAAALRSQTSSPIQDISTIQTKRMIRRGSQSSIGSGSLAGTRGAPARGGLQRRDSQGSMTERTFRSPSPGRANGAVSPPSDYPPVPAIPKNIPTKHERSSSVDPPARIMSPGHGGRAQSLDRISLPPLSAARPGKRLSNVNEELERTDSNRNVNFSRPRSSQPSSPVSPTSDNPYTHGTGNWFSEAVPTRTQPQQTQKEAALESKIARIQAAAGQPVKKDHSVASSQGTYLSRATQQAENSSAAPTNVSGQPMETVMIFDPSSRTFVPGLRPKPKVIEPPSPILAQLPTPAPGTYDPNTRTIVPATVPKTLASVGPSAALASLSQKQPTLDTDLEPPPRNPARLSPINTSPGRQLHKQPSVVHEEPEEQIQPPMGSAFVGTNRTTQTLSSPAKSYAQQPGQKQRSNSLDVPPGAMHVVQAGRGSSHSPSPQRSARFSASPVVQATIHNPPPRDVSPAKPALKHHSPASSVRTSSPMANGSVPKSPISETSETSQDGLTGKKKKSVRVSFDEQPHEIDAATAAAPKTLTRDRSPFAGNDDDEELMKPRPALPSFGSVRNQRVSPAVAEKVTEMAPERHDISSDHAIGGILKNASERTTMGEPLPPEVTSKESAGYVSDESEDLTTPAAAGTPAKPSAVPVIESEFSPKEPKVRDFAPAPEPNSTLSAGVPAINLLPPTPGVEDEDRTLDATEPQSPKAKSSFEINVPGGWDKYEENDAEGTSANGASTVPSQVQDHSALIPEEEPVIYQSPQPRSPILDAIEESDSDDSAEFSDAAEDLSELDNGGYASLNAIAVSPVINASPTDKSTLDTASPPESPTLQQAAKKAKNTQPDASPPSGDWSSATAYWSQLSKQQRAQIEREHLSSDDESRPVSTLANRTKKKTAPRTTDTDTGNVSAAIVKAQPATQGSAAQTQTTMRKSMRAQPGTTSAERETHMRTSMRSGGGTGMATTLRGGPPPPKQQASTEPNGPLQQKSMRPSSSTSGTATLRKSASPPTATQSAASTRVPSKPKPQPAPVMPAKLQREMSHDSDSESSFKKKRRPSASTVDTQGRNSMKRSMRGAPTQAGSSAREERPVSPTPARGRGRDSFSIRSLSPTGSLFGRKKKAEEVRQSIRGTSMDAGPRMTLRNGPPAKSSAKPTRTQKPVGSRFKSRFADSDDEGDDDKPSRGLFRSRFADSDDSDDDNFIAADLTPVRGIPRRQGQYDGDSTDLEDEDEDQNPRKSTRQREKQHKPLVPDPADIDKAMEAARKKLGMTDQAPAENSQGTSLQKGSLRKQTQPEPKSKPDDVDFTPEKKKRGFMGSILRRNRGSTASVPQVSSPILENPPPLPSNPAVTASPAVEPAARPQSPVSPSGKLIRRASAQQTPQQTRMKRGDSNFSNVTAPPDVRDTDGAKDWPFPAVPKIPEHLDARPQTSDGSPPKQQAASVRFEDPGDANARAVYSQRTGKKKKFSMLRRAFGLND